MIPIFLAVHIIGVAPWCMVDVKEQTIQCNYDTQEECLSYNYNGEICIENPNFK